MNFYTIGEAADILGYTTKTLRNWDKEGTFKPDFVDKNFSRWYSQQQLESRLGKTIEEATKKFFNHDEIIELLNKAGTVGLWNFETACGDIMHEKGESFFVKISEITSVMIKKGASGYFWIVCPPEICSLFDNKLMLNDDEQFEQQPMGTQEIIYQGLMHRKWKVYTDNQILISRESAPLLIGCNDKLEEPSHYGKLNTLNFVL